MLYSLLLTLCCNVLCVVCLSNVTADDIDSTLDNGLWSGLIRDCKDPTTGCLKDSIYDYLKNTLDYRGDLQFTSFMKFSKNAIDYNETEPTDEEDPIDPHETPMEEVSRSLADNTRRFFMTHDIELRLPDTFFLGTTLKISPRGFNDNGTMVKLEVVPKEIEESVGEGRIFFKKIKKFISERLVYALIAIILVIKLVAVKVLFVLPAILGAAAAKKMILKFLLFVFPFLHNLFKWCAYTPYGAKHHIHRHQISHIHEVAHGGHHHHHHKPYHGHHHHGVEVIAPHADGPPHVDEFAHKDFYEPYGDPGDPYVENDVLHRKDTEEHEEDNEIDLWTQGQVKKKRRPTGRKPTPTEIENMVLKAEKEALIKFRLEKERQRIHEENLRLQEHLNNALKLQEKLKHKATMVNPHLPLTPGLLPPPPLIVAPLVPPPPPQKVIPQPIAGYQQPQVSQVQNQPYSYQVFNGMRPTQVANPHGFAEPPALGPAGNMQRVPNQPGINNQLVGGAGPSKTAQLAIDYIKQQQSPQPQPLPNTSSLQKSTNNPLTPPPLSTTPKPKTPSPKEELYSAAAITFDPFYSPILERMDKILLELNFKDESCRERLVCSMYKNPEKFSPHSNLLSAELSRDSKELQKPKKTNAAVIRFYKYVQAARDGQDNRDCLKLYDSCAINTEI